jgi:hypothetical protein
MEFSNLKRFLAESSLYRRLDQVIGFLSYREVRQLRFERSDVAPVGRRAARKTGA